MGKNIQPYHLIDLPIERRLMAGFNDLYWQHHCMYGLLEVDVTIVKQFIEDYKAQTGVLLSFTGFLTYCLARAVDEDKTVQAYMKGRKQLVVYDDVNVGLMVERKLGEKHILMGHVVQGANHKTYPEIHQEIRSVQAKPVTKGRGAASWFLSGMLLPWPLSGLFKSLIRLVTRYDPTITASMTGTVGITAVGMFGEGHSGWGIAPITHVLGLVVGSTAWKPAVVQGRIEPRELLHLTVVFDHDVIDGAPAARFTKRLVELIESGQGLADVRHLPVIATDLSEAWTAQVFA